MSSFDAQSQPIRRRRDAHDGPTRGSHGSYASPQPGRATHTRIFYKTSELSYVSAPAVARRLLLYLSVAATTTPAGWYKCG